MLETYGAWGPAAIQFLRVLAAHLPQVEEDEEKKAAFFRRAIAIVNFALQRGNAHVSSRGSMRVRALQTVAERAPAPLALVHGGERD